MFDKLGVADAQDALISALADDLNLSVGLVLAGIVVCEVHDQAFLTAGHRDIDLGKNLGVELGTVQRAMRVVYAIALAQRVQVVLLAWI